MRHKLVPETDNLAFLQIAGHGNQGLHGSSAGCGGHVPPYTPDTKLVRDSAFEAYDIILLVQITQETSFKISL